jgi:hypothetical protein
MMDIQVSMQVFMPELPVYVAGPHRVEELVMLLYGVKVRTSHARVVAKAI